MSELLRVALVAEGPTDRVVIEAAMRSMLDERPFVLTQLQPEGSLAFGPRGGGWVGVYRWCKQAASRGQGRLSADRLLFETYHVLVLHVDADVAGREYTDATIVPDSADGRLPCQQPCPPASATTDALRGVLLSWCGEVAAPDRVVLCIPSKSTEAWVIAALFPGDRAMSLGIECYPDPEGRLAPQPKRGRIRKTQRDYQARATDLQAAWSATATPAVCGEALRFQQEFCARVRGA
ncbi:MAG: hypothetical protein AB1505_01950 [Candidatus Latescibacterota bacterium]